MAVVFSNTFNLSSSAPVLGNIHNHISTKQQQCHEYCQLKPLRMRRVPVKFGNILTRACYSSSSSPAMTLYDVLSVPMSVELGELKKAYREKVRIYHPDVCPPGERDKSCEMFLQLQEAYETLSDPMRRTDYDFNLRFNPHIMLLQRRNGSAEDEAKQVWAQQLQCLSKRSRSRRDSWGERMRSFKEKEAHGIS